MARNGISGGTNNNSNNINYNNSIDNNNSVNGKENMGNIFTSFGTPHKIIAMKNKELNESEPKLRAEDLDDYSHNRVERPKAATQGVIHYQRPQSYTNID